MTELWVPPLEGEPWPTLGPQVADFIESYLVYGPGDLRGEPMRLTAHMRTLIWRCYEVHPEDHPQAGRRRFRRVALSQRKGTAKTEFAALLAACELHPDGPVRCVGFDGAGRPIGRGVKDPYIPMVAYTEEQSDELAYSALRVILEESRVAGDFDIGLERILRKGGDGKAVALASAPNARDGARTTFEHFDETHRFILPRLKQAHRTMLANLPKRRIADPWALETTTAPAPGERSVAEEAFDYAKSVEAGQRQDTRLLFFHRQASDSHDLDTPAGLRAAVLEASGPDAEWSDIDGIIEQWQDPTADTAYLERVWLNKPVQATSRAFDAKRWAELQRDEPIAQGARITIGFDGSRTQGATALVGTVIETGYQFLIGVWEQPLNAPEDWEVPIAEVDQAVAGAFEAWQVWRMYADPRWFETWIAAWAGRYGEKVVLEWPTNRPRQMAAACLAYATAINAGEVGHGEDEVLTRHLGAAVRHSESFRDENDQPMWTIRKERPDSPLKIDAVMAAILSWEARNDAIAAGVLEDVGSQIFV